MSVSLSRLSVRYQIGLLGALGVAGLLIVGAVYFDGMARIAAHQQVAAEALATEELSDSLDRGLLLARRAEKDFLLRLDPQYAEAHTKLRGELLATLTGLKTRLQSSGWSELARRADGLQGGLQAYFAQFSDVAGLQGKLGLTEAQGLQGALRGAVHDVEDKLSDTTKLSGATEPQLTILMLMMRRHEKDFIARRDPAYGVQMKQRADEFAKALAASALPEAARTAIAADMTRYQASFSDFMAATLAIGTSSKELSRLYAEIEPGILAIRRDVSDLRVKAIGAADAGRVETGRLIGVAIAAVTAIVALLGFGIARGIHRPLLRLSETMRRLAGGEHDIAVPDGGRRDEIGTMSQSVLVFRDGLIAADRLTAAQEEMRAEAERDRRALLVKLADECEASMGAVMNTVSSSATQVRSTAQTLVEAAGQASARSSRVSSGAAETSANVQTVAAATEELTTSIAEITRQVGEASEIAGTAVMEADATNATVTALNGAAVRIGSVVDLINEIASQTNLLALNATIEAARAGEAGKGFAVVASEVKSLAGQTARATSEIQAHVAAIQQESNQAAEAIGGIGETIGRLNEISASVAAAVRQQGAATAEIARNVQQAAQGTEIVTENIAQVDEAARLTGSSAGEMLDASRSLTDHASRLREEITALGARIRAA